jgi:hypothetical protein
MKNAVAAKLLGAGQYFPIFLCRALWEYARQRHLFTVFFLFAHGKDTSFSSSFS